mgnify:CR=1 FL=1|jgi:hypothetical protein
MADQKSNGLIGLSHYKNSRISQDLMEPLYLNIFTVQISLPSALGATEQDTNLLLEGVQKVGGLDTTKNPGAVTQNYKYAQRSFAGSRPENTYIDVSFDFEVNLQYSNGTPGHVVLKQLRQWSDLIFDPLTGRTGLKKDYIAPNATVTMQDRAGNPYRQWILYNLFPITQITVPELDYMSQDLYKVTGWTCRCDYFNEIIL